jgi:hypothetical protein
MSEENLRTDVQSAIKAYEAAIGRAASRTHQFIEAHGDVEGLSKLMVSPDMQQGFKVLCATGQSDKSFEAAVVRHSELFRPEIVKAAQWRLDRAATGH